MDQVYDIAIIGGGINGCGCAADAALRGLSVILFEQDDLASKTSSSSTKLIHGGLRYLEHYEFKLVKKALEERHTLLNVAPHIVHDQSFVLPYQKHMRPAWLLRLGLFFYDHLSRLNHLPKSRSIRRGITNNYFNPLKDNFNRGFLFYDGSTDDSRLTILNAIQAKNHGAHIKSREKVIQADVIDHIWHLSVKPQIGAGYTVRAKSLINAAGPWVQSIAKLSNTAVHQEISLIKGSHIVVPKLYEGKQAYFLQNADNRVVFVIPYHGFHMIGTTEVRFYGDANHLEISQEEMDYLTDLVNTYFNINIGKEDIVYSWSGVRPLIANQSKDAGALSRDYVYELALEPAPVLTIFGGKITTYRQLAEESINKLAPLFSNMKPCLTKHTPLPGATYLDMTFTTYMAYAKNKYHWLNPELLNRYLNSYGCYTEVFLSQCNSEKDMGKKYGDSLYQVEVDYLVLEEWAVEANDVLFRRTKLGLTMDDTSKKELAEYLKSRSSVPVQVEPVFH
ncbi:glycerol-3-phosphate dehydrogenase [Legionella waltersii]|uniref:Glycerol-3-phosphate dehydrogenase n=1 Tax=Legionella waltersii TaxID=66969 RepID=A0A0W1ALZ9_9GAMM|nr:glycerol-3-phosphate dehydrogenase [Legionella waltersii]KTD82288.1 glycerol-3-phosphate dehydrogenase [Legionella waltersii]SNV04252.1 glycerol-3-phosphate dehydrogenase [Legionella waltersii]